ncbi:MAG: HAD family hydrolase, partial [Candidatus Hodarchaeota archaeon]
MIKNVLFDIDDTLYDHQFASSQAIQSLASNYYRITGFNEPLKFIQAYYRVKSELDGLNPKSFDKTSHFLKIIRLANREGKVDLAKELGKSYWKEILKRTVPYPDVKPTLIILKKQRYQLGIVSDGLIQTQSLRLNKLGFSDLF